MPCCCINTLNLCNKPVCGRIEFNKLATSSGEYDLVLDFLETTVTITEEQVDGENISFDISALNENFQYTGKVYDDSGDIVTFTVDEVEYDCIKFKTILNVSL